MPKNWSIRKIGEIGEVVGGGTPSTKEESYYGGKIPWITPKDLSDHKFVFISRGERNITNLGLKKSSAKLMPKGTVLFSSRAPIGYVAIAKNEISTNQGFKSIVCNEKIVNNKFIYYSLKNYKKAIENVASGSTFKEVSGKVLKKFTISIPPLEEQNKIAEILFSLDSKIELNQRMNQALEEIGRTIFKHWFVDFEFPDEQGRPYKSSGGEMVDSELGEIPKGWEVCFLPEVSKIVDCLHTKKPETTPSDLILLQVYNINEDGTLDLTNNYTVSDSDYKEWTKNILLKEGDCLVTNAGRVGAIGQVPSGFVGGIGRNITAIRPANIKPTYLLRYLFSKHGMMEIKRLTDDGTVLNSLNVRGIKKIRILIPPEDIRDNFELMARSLRKKVEKNNSESDLLRGIRDSILPKLMSGKIRVKLEGLDENRKNKN